MKPVHLHPEAEAESDALFEWYWAQSESAALRLDEQLRANLSSSPRRYPLYLRGTRRVLLHRFPVSVVFLELRDRIQILAIAHAKRSPGYWKSRL
jgi:plasmid stabilization system protein ParE